jgi:hypothetical protein
MEHEENNNYFLQKGGCLRKTVDEKSGLNTKNILVKCHKSPKFSERMAAVASKPPQKTMLLYEVSYKRRLGSWE